MPAPTACTICEHPDRERIDVALRGSASLRSIAKSFGVGRTAIAGHAAKHTTAEQTRRFRIAARGGRRRSGALRVPEPVAAEPIRTPESVTAHLERIVAKSWAMHDEAERTRDWRLANTAMTQIVNALDKIAKSVGMYSDGNVVNVNPIDAKIIAVVESMSTDELRQFIRATTSAPDALEAVSE